MPDLQNVILRLCRQRLGREPDLKNPTGYNDLIQWLKLYDQRPEHIICCDKREVRNWVSRIAGSEVLIPVEAGLPPRAYPVVAKATHDSGSAIRIPSLAGVPAAHVKLKNRVSRIYGVEKGEWAYQFLTPGIIVEREIGQAPADFKFHCSHDQIRWVQVIRDRGRGTRETILDRDGKVLPLHMDQNMKHDPDPKACPSPKAWAELTRLALKLAQGWRYVRVDLYWVDQKAWFGEMTFWPLSGCYATKDEPKFGEMLDLDLSTTLKPIVQ